MANDTDNTTDSTATAAGDGETTKKATSTPKKNTKGSTGRTAPKLPERIVTTDGDTTHVSVIDTADTADMARALLDAATTPADVTATTGPAGWNIPTALAKKLNLA